MQITVLGSGTAVPHPQRSSPGFWVETEGRSLILDFGPSVHHRAAAERLDWPDLDAIWISHFHLDHCCGLPAFLFATRNAPMTQQRKKPLRITGPKGIIKLLEAFNDANDYKLFKQPFSIEIFEVEHLESFEILPNVSATVLKTPHTNESLALRFEDHSGRSMVYSSDTGFARDLSAFARDADLFIIESSYFQDKTTEKHLELAEAMLTIRHAKPARAMLTHFYAEWDNVDFDKEVAKFAPTCEVIEARDGLRIEV
jgi:ribonuclease BN (tRNA processing enzyme)